MALVDLQNGMPVLDPKRIIRDEPILDPAGPLDIGPSRTLRSGDHATDLVIRYDNPRLRVASLLRIVFESSNARNPRSRNGARKSYARI